MKKILLIFNCFTFFCANSQQPIQIDSVNEENDIHYNNKDKFLDICCGTNNSDYLVYTTSDKTAPEFFLYTSQLKKEIVDIEIYDFSGIRLDCDYSFKKGRINIVIKSSHSSPPYVLKIKKALPD